jgi:hypothetical protein
LHALCFTPELLSRACDRRIDCVHRTDLRLSVCRDLLEPKGSSDVHFSQEVIDSPYFEVGMTNSAPLEILSGQRCMTLFCLV